MCLNAAKFLLLTYVQNLICIVLFPFHFSSFIFVDLITLAALSNYSSASICYSQFFLLFHCATKCAKAIRQNDGDVEYF